MAIKRPDSYERIQGYAFAYADLWKKEIPSGIGKGGADEDFCAVLMERGDVARLLLHPKCHKLAAIIGIEDHDDSTRITISLLVVGENGKIIPEHLKAPNGELKLEGEEVWPKRVKISELKSFLPSPPQE